MNLLIIYTVGTAIFWKMSPRQSKHKTGEEITKGVDMSGKNAMITGPTSGIGFETARVLALRGAHVILVSRNEKKLQASVEKILKGNPKASVEYIQCDLSDQDSIRKCVSVFLEKNLPLHLLINNAGLMALRERRETAQGLEMQVGVNHIGHSLLTLLLKPTLEASQPSRVVCLSSLAHHYWDGKFQDDPKLETTPYEKWVAYGNAKISNLMFAQEFDRRYSSKGISACSVHPGGIFTGLQDEVEATTMFKWIIVAPFFFKSIEQGAATTLLCATTDKLEGGKYYSDCKVSKHKTFTDDQCKALWKNTIPHIKPISI